MFLIRVVTVDEEKLSLKHLNSMLKSFKDVKIVGSYQQPSTALSKIKSLQPHIIIFDISMSEMDGFKFAEQAASLFPGVFIVFLSTYDGFALKAFEVGAYDYILKPLSEDRLNKLIKRAKHDLTHKIEKNISVPEKHIQNQFSNFITANKADSIIVISKPEIMYCCASNKKTYVYIEEGCFECRYTLEQLETMLNPYLFRCHRAYLVNLNYVRELAPMFNQTYIIRLKNSRAEIPVSRNYASKIKQLLNA